MDLIRQGYCFEYHGVELVDWNDELIFTTSMWLVPELSWDERADYEDPLDLDFSPSTDQPELN